MKLLIVDDHQLYIDGMRLLLGNLDDISAIEECTKGKEAIARLEAEEGFDLAMIDLAIPDMDGLAILQRLRETGSLVPVVVVSADEDIARISYALELGALGYVPKEHNSEEMLDALRLVISGEIYVPTAIQGRLNSYRSRRHPEDGTLTKRQKDVLKLVARGYSNKRIASSLFLAEHTVKVHIAAILKSLNATNRTECVHKAQSQGLLD